MKVYKYILTVLLVLFVFVANCQPLPPSTPNGNPVPVGNVLEIVAMLMLGAGAVHVPFKNLVKRKAK